MKLSRFVPLIGILIFVYLIHRIGFDRITSTIFKFNNIMYYALLLIPLLMLVPEVFI